MSTFLSATVADRVALLDNLGLSVLVEHETVDGRPITTIVATDQRGLDLYQLGVLFLKKVAKIAGEAELDSHGKKEQTTDPSNN